MTSPADRIAELERQNADLQAANNTYRDRAIAAETVIARASIPLTFATLRSANLGRLGEAERVFDGHSMEWWTLAVMSCAGGLCAAVRKNVRGDGMRSEVSACLAETIIQIDLLAARLHIDLAFAVARTFNVMSERTGAPQRLWEVMPLEGAAP